jgi:hypothetical protein
MHRIDPKGRLKFGCTPPFALFQVLNHSSPMTPSEYLKTRVEDQIDWYSTKSRNNKNWYIRLEIAAILLSVSIPFVSNFMTGQALWVKHCVSFMGVSIAAITGLLALMKYRDNWIEYRSTSEMLKREHYMYITKSGAYSGKGRFNLFVQSIEGILSREISQWKKYQTASQEEDDEADDQDMETESNDAGSDENPSVATNSEAANPQDENTQDVPVEDASEINPTK